METNRNSDIFGHNSCAMLSREDKDRLWSVAELMAEEKGIVLRMSGSVMGFANKVTSLLPKVVTDKIENLSNKAVKLAYDAGISTMEAKSEREPWNIGNRLFTTTTGIVSGFVGLPGVLVDIPVTTSLMLRSIAEIARQNGEDITTPEGKLNCIEVFAFGGEGAPNETVESSYWATRFSFTSVTIDATIRQIASRFSISLSQKIMAQSAPILGAVAGGVLNYSFMEFYQNMAKIHFGIRAIERNYLDSSCVRACLSTMVDSIKSKKGQ
jgi:hypothetical protein